MVLDAGSAQRWCSERGVFLDEADRPRLRYDGRSWGMMLNVPREAGRVLSLAYVLVTTFLDFDDERRFKGCLTWVAEKGIWSESHDRVGERLANGLRIGAAEGSSIDERPAHLFDGAELVDAQSFALLVLLFGWDAFLIPSSGGYFVFAHHDGQVYFIAKTFEILADLKSRFRAWAPDDGVPRYLRSE